MLSVGETSSHSYVFYATSLPLQKHFASANGFHTTEISTVPTTCTTTYFISALFPNLPFLLFTTQCILSIRYGLTRAACTPLCHITGKQPGAGPATCSTGAASCSVINYPGLQEHPPFNCSVKCRHILKKNVKKKQN